MTKNDCIIVRILGFIVAIFALIILYNLGYFHKGFFVLILIIPILANVAVGFTFLLSKQYPIFYDIGKFAAVGSSTFFVDAGIYNLLVLITNTGTSGIQFTIFKGIAFLSAALYSFCWYKFWTFKHDQLKNSTAEVIRFCMVSIMSLLVNTGTSTGFIFLKNIFPINISAIIWANIGVVLGSALAMVINFLGYKFIVFKKT